MNFRSHIQYPRNSLTSGIPKPKKEMKKYLTNKLISKTAILVLSYILTNCITNPPAGQKKPQSQCSDMISTGELETTLI